MKKLLVLLLAASFVTSTVSSCGGKKEEAKKGEGDAYSDYETAEPAKASTADLIAQGETLINASDCKTCHTKDNRLIGPAYTTEVAKKYEFTRANVNMLADKIINGGAGNWGDVPMTAHPDISKADAEKMAMYVLSLDGEELKD